jgi:uncharacterized protein involved in exopolysaccharide biosynthesis
MNSNTVRNESVIYDDEIDLKELFNVLWKHKKLIILVTSFFALGSIFYSLTLTNHYKSEAVLNIAGASNANTSLSGLGGLASMAGINLPISSENKATLAIKIIQSRAFLKHLITFEHIMPSIMAAKSYDHQSKKILFDPKIYNKDDDKWVRKSQKNQQAKPSYLEAYDTYLQQVLISQEKETGFITLSVEHISPIFAKEFLDLIISETNELLRNQDLRESTDAIEFLVSEIPKSSLISMKDAINQLVLSKLEMQMMAKISSEYVLKIIEPPFVPEKKSQPKRTLIVILGTLLGGMFATLWVFIRHYVQAV